VPEKLYHVGFRAPVSRSTLTDASENRDWRIYADFAQVLIGIARPLYAEEDLGLDLEETVYALDSTTIDLCLSVFPWAQLGRTRSAIKLHTLLDLRGNIPANIWITRASFADVRLLDVLLPEPGALYVLDRGYVDFARLADLDRRRATFVIRAKKNLRFRRLYSHPVDRKTGLVCDQTIKLTEPGSAADYPEKLRRVRFRDPEKNEAWTYLTNDFVLPALTVADLYRCRWQVELFFKWIKQHLRIKAFYGTSPNAVRTQLWIAISVYVFEKTRLEQVLSAPGYTPKDADIRNQSSLFEF
jgi:IS4 transposase